MNLQDVRMQLYNELLNLRSIERLVGSVSFEIAWAKATQDQKDEVTRYINSRNTLELKKWIQHRNQADCTIRDLKIRAMQLGVKSYSRLSKDDLLIAIYQKEEILYGTDGQPTGTDGDPDSGDGGQSASNIREGRVQTDGNHLQESHTPESVCEGSRIIEDLAGGNGEEPNCQVQNDESLSERGALAAIQSDRS